MCEYARILVEFLEGDEEYISEEDVEQQLEKLAFLTEPLGHLEPPRALAVMIPHASARIHTPRALS